MFTRVHAALITGILLTVLDQMDAAVIKALSVSFTDVSTAIGLAQEGDTVIVPPGTANWSSMLSVTKGITLQGATIVTGAGTSAASVSDQTIIVDNLAGSDGNVMSVTINANQNFRLTGFTFRPGSGGSNDVLLSSSGTQPVMKLRVDHCHFTNSSDRCLITWGWVYGVADHNLMNCSGRSQSFYINMPSHSNKTQGHGAWADYPWFGTISPSSLRITPLSLRAVPQRWVLSTPSMAHASSRVTIVSPTPEWAGTVPKGVIGADALPKSITTPFIGPTSRLVR